LVSRVRYQSKNFSSMIYFIRHFSVLLIAGFSFSNAIAQTGKTKRIDSLIKAANEFGIFNGNVLVAKEGKIIYQKEIGFADNTKTKSLNTESRFAIGSITKEFANVAVLLMQEKHKLSIEDKVSKYLPQLPGWADKIQIKQLLDYTSGLPSSNADSDSSYMSNLMKLEKLEFEPGTSYNYSNDNIFLQRKIVEKQSGMNFDVFMDNYFFKPLKMSGVLINPRITNTELAQSFDNDFNSTTTYQGNNELYLTLTDLYKWSEAIDHYKIINKISICELSKNFAGNESSLGLVKVSGDSLKWHVHQGSGNNYEALLYSDGENRLTIILMTNNQNFKVNQLKDALVNILNNQPYSVPKKSIYLDIRKKLFDNFNQGIAFYNDIKVAQKEKYDWTNEVADLYSTGKYLMRRNRFEDAIKILDLSVLVDLKNAGGLSYAYTLIGECYLKSSSIQMAGIYYKKALELDSTNKTAEGMIKQLLAEKKIPSGFN
jgi:CubicO group peptidase (beta-lactamase class C family)